MNAIPSGLLTLFPALSGLVTGVSGVTVGICRNPADPIGTLFFTLTNLIDGSSIQIESQAGNTTLHNSVVSGTSKTLTLSVYASGDSRNDLRIKVRKGSAAPFYQPWETLATAVVGSQSIYVAQISDQ